MTVSKRARYEILRRDKHTCRYCGAAAPDVHLTVDHVIPTTLGGSDDPSNLVAACRDCNSGKSSISPDAPIVADVDERASVWAFAMARVAEERIAEREFRRSLHEYFDWQWSAWGWTDQHGERHACERDDNWKSSVEQFYAAGLTTDDFGELIAVAMRSKAQDTWTYFCGCCWTRVRQNQERASEIIDDMLAFIEPDEAAS